jgi:predicted enzyme related to lactoylglutathione lyase
MKKRVTGIGGIFFKAQDPKKLGQWYQQHLDIEIEAEATASTFRWREKDNPEQTGATVWGLFPKETTYFGDKDRAFMINYRVENLEKLLEILKSEGVQVVKPLVNTEQGRFAWIIDPEGNRIELWQAPVDY